MRDFAPVIAECQRRLGGEPEGARRLFHGRGHCFPGYEDLVVDRFGRYLLIGCFGADTQGSAELGRQLAMRLDGIAGVAVQQRQGRRTQARMVLGEIPPEIEVIEAGCKFAVKPLGNQNVGLFLDMAPTRNWVRANASGRRVLNLFSFTCTFSVAALDGGATHVVNNDMSRSALDWGRANHLLNGHDSRMVSMLPHNLFKAWRKIRQLGPYGLVIIDPPTNQRGSFVAEKQYGQVMKRLSELCSPGADVIACLNSPFLNADFLKTQMARWCPEAQFAGDLPSSEDFPDRFPDRGLKVARFRFRG
ncbi:MAG: class I SAM-dependent methyltransferase [Pseudomonadales bacterium]